MSYHSRLALEAALDQLNRATEREYSITGDGDSLTLVIPAGGAYPPATAQELLQRLVTLRIAADGRQAVKPVTA